ATPQLAGSRDRDDVTSGSFTPERCRSRAPRGSPMASAPRVYGETRWRLRPRAPSAGRGPEAATPRAPERRERRPRARGNGGRMPGHEVSLPRLRRADEAPRDRGARGRLARRHLPLPRVRLPGRDADEPVRDPDGQEPRRQGGRPDRARP